MTDIEPRDDERRDDEHVAKALRDALTARDGSQRATPFAALWPDQGSSRVSIALWRPALATVAAVAVLAGLSWTLLSRNGAPESPGPTSVDAALARELSSSEFWRVPTDELLAYAAPSPGIELPSPPGFEVSLEESLL